MNAKLLLVRRQGSVRPRAASDAFSRVEAVGRDQLGDSGAQLAA